MRNFFTVDFYEQEEKYYVLKVKSLDYTSSNPVSVVKWVSFNTEKAAWDVAKFLNEGEYNAS